jgi:dihydrofolate reductase
MRKLIYSMGVSADGYIVGPDGKFDWATPDEELHRFHNEQARATGMQLYGRRLYETMRVWETIGDEAEPAMAEFARIWKATPKLVFSNTLDRVEGPKTALADEDPVTTVKRLKEEPGEPLAVGGAGLAETLVRAGLVDEYGLFVNPIIVGGGTPFFPKLEQPIPLRLVETRTFGSRVVHMRYEAA